MQPFPVSVVIHRQLSASFLLKHPSCSFSCRRSRGYCSSPSDASCHRLKPSSQSALVSIRPGNTETALTT